MYKELNSFVKDAVNHYQKLAIDLSDSFFAHPELSYEEFQSSKRITDILAQAGYEVEYPFSGFPTAFCGKLDNGEGPSIAILVEYDALPDIGHGCGHNLHGAMAVLAALAITNLKEHFKGKVHVIGTPGEETDGSKIIMSDKGVFDNFDLAMMIHSFAGGYSESVMKCLALSYYRYKFHGQTSHAAICPWDGKNAVTAMRKFLDLLDARRQGFMPDVRVSSLICEGGRALNIIPDLGECLVEFRAESLEKLNAVTEVASKCAKAAAMAFDCELELERCQTDFADLVINKSAEAEISRILESLGVKMRPTSPASGSSDIGNVSYHCPVIHPLLSIADEPLILHTVEFAKATVTPQAHEALVTGAEALTRMALSVFNNDELRENIHKEFNSKIGSILK